MRINFPTSNDPACLDFDRDTLAVHLPAVRGAQAYGRGIPVRIVVRGNRVEVAPYGIEVEDGDLLWAPRDSDEVIRKREGVPSKKRKADDVSSES